MTEAIVTNVRLNRESRQSEAEVSDGKRAGILPLDGLESSHFIEWLIEKKTGAKREAAQRAGGIGWTDDDIEKQLTLSPKQQGRVKWQK